MKTFQYTIREEIGIHARPAGMLVNEAKKFTSRIILEYNGKKAEATKLMMIMMLGAKKGAEVTISVDGADEEAAAAAMKDFFENNL